MLKTIKMLGTVLTVASTAQIGKELYSTYKDKKRQRQIQEVHNFIENLDLEILYDAIETEDTEKLIEAVESIIRASENVRAKSELEEISDDLTGAAKVALEKVTDIANKVVEDLSHVFDELIDDNDDVENEDVVRLPTFDEFINGAELPIFDKDGGFLVTVNDANVFVKMQSKTVFVEIIEKSSGNTKVKQITLI